MESTGPLFEDKICVCPGGKSLKAGDTTCGPCQQCKTTSSLAAISSITHSMYAESTCSGPGTETVCSNCTRCAQDEYVASACTATENTGCKKCTTCNWASQWMLSACSSGWNGNSTVGSSRNHLNEVGYDTKCRSCSAYQCDIGQHGVACISTADTSCNACNNSIPDHAHWNGSWTPPHPAPQAVGVKCLFECNPVFEFNPSDDTCVCPQGRYLHKFTVHDRVPSIMQEFVPPAQGECKPCSICKPGERILSLCNRTHDTVCVICPEATSFAMSEPVHHFQMTQLCKGTGSCTVNFDNVEADVELTVSVVLTDFRGYDKYISGVFVGDGAGTRIGDQDYLRRCKSPSGFVECPLSQCDKEETILHRSKVPAKAINSNQKLQVRITASESIGARLCQTYSLLAHVTISRARADWDHDRVNGSVYDSVYDICTWKCDNGYAKNANGTDCVCGNGHYVNDDPRASTACKPCSSCPKGQMTLEACSITSDTVCVDCCNEKPQNALFTGDFSLTTGKCDWRCKNGFYRGIPGGSNVSATQLLASPSPRDASLPWACKYVFDGSVPGDHLSGVAYGDRAVCSECTKCDPVVEYVASECSLDQDTICKKCSNPLPLHARYSGTAQNISGNMTCDWQCGTGYWKKDNSTCAACTNKIPAHAVFVDTPSSKVTCEWNCEKLFTRVRARLSGVRCDCIPGNYYNGSHCIPCTTCRIGEFPSSTCTQSTVDPEDTVCVRCSNPLPQGSIYTGGGYILNGSVWCHVGCIGRFFYNATSGRCQKCSQCEVGKYVDTTCDPTHDTRCLVCPNSLPQYANFTGISVYDASTITCEWQCMNHKGFYTDISKWVELGRIPGLVSSAIPPNFLTMGGSGGAIGVAGSSVGGGSGGGVGSTPGLQNDLYTGPCRCPEDGYYLSKSIEGESCKKCTTCKLGFYTTQKCNATADAVCTTCPNSKPYMSEYTGVYPTISSRTVGSNTTVVVLPECEWKCNPNFEKKIVKGLPQCECIPGSGCSKCPKLPTNGKLLNLCLMYTDASTGVCSFDDTTLAGIVMAVLMPMTLAVRKLSLDCMFMY
jgi:hypothetical protein